MWCSLSEVIFLSNPFPLSTCACKESVQFSVYREVFSVFRPIWCVPFSKCVSTWILFDSWVRVWTMFVRTWLNLLLLKWLCFTFCLCSASKPTSPTGTWSTTSTRSILETSVSCQSECSLHWQETGLHFKTPDRSIIRLWVYSRVYISLQGHEQWNKTQYISIVRCMSEEHQSIKLNWKTIKNSICKPTRDCKPKEINILCMLQPPPGIMEFACVCMELLSGGWRVGVPCVQWHWPLYTPQWMFQSEH